MCVCVCTYIYAAAAFNRWIEDMQQLRNAFVNKALQIVEEEVSISLSNCTFVVGNYLSIVFLKYETN